MVNAALPWISVKDELPLIGKFVFIWIKDRGALSARAIRVACLCPDLSWKIWHKPCYIDTHLVDHWRPLFEAPLEELEEADDEDEPTSWISITESLPPEGEVVFIWIGVWSAIAPGPHCIFKAQLRACNVYDGQGCMPRHQWIWEQCECGNPLLSLEMASHWHPIIKPAVLERSEFR